MIRHSTITVEEGLELLNLWKTNYWDKRLHKEYEEINLVAVKTYSQRYSIFRKNQKCVHCGLEACFFAIEKVNDFNKTYHLNMYCLDEDGNEVMMTKDHILAKSRGGKNAINNYQVMCLTCNQLKGNKKEIKVQTLEEKLLEKLGTSYIVERISNRRSERVLKFKDKFYKFKYKSFSSKKTQENYIYDLEEITHEDFKEIVGYTDMGLSINKLEREYAYIKRCFDKINKLMDMSKEEYIILRRSIK